MTDTSPKIKFDMTLNLGHVLTVASFAVVAMVNWNVFDRRLTVLEEARKVQELRDAAQDLTSKERSVEIKERLADIQASVNYMRDKLDRRKQ